MATIGDKIVGCVVIREESLVKVHILALGVLVLHREKGTASRLMEECLQGIEEAYLHVQTDNQTAIQFYKQRGFVVTETVPDYYKRVTCTEAVKMEWRRTQL